MAQEWSAEIPAGDIERYHAAAVELAEESRRIVRPALERGFAVETKADASLVVAREGVGAESTWYQDWQL